MDRSAQLTCSQCGYRTVRGITSMVEWLRGCRMVRRDAAPEPELVPELFRSAAGKFVCPQCGAKGLAVGPVEDLDDAAWGMGRACDACGRPIDAERLAALPDTRLCVACQAKDDRGQTADEPEYCPRCGSLMAVRQTRGSGVTRYKQVCPQCRR
jgi:predicted RNA-binding Zn-ribbon protein involved in translation (DUF1610 family)